MITSQHVPVPVAHRIELYFGKFGRRRRGSSTRVSILKPVHLTIRHRCEELSSRRGLYVVWARKTNFLHSRMNEDFVLSVLAETKSLIEHGGVSSRYQNNLYSLGILLKETNCNEAKRDIFASAFLQTSTNILAEAFSFHIMSDNEIELYLRNLRGLVLFVRNLIVSTSAQLDLVSLFSSMRKLTSNVEHGQKIFTACLQAFLQVLANYCLNQTSKFISFSADLVTTLDKPIVTFIQGEEKLDLRSPFNVFLSKYLLSRDDGTVVFMHGEHAHLMEYIFEEALNQAHADCFPSGLLPFFEKLVTEREFGSWLKKRDSPQFVTRILTVCQLVVTNKQDWDTPKCEVMITWVFEVCKDLMDTSVHLLESKTSDDAAIDLIRTQLVRALDILSDLCKFSIVQQYLRDLYAIDIFIRLLRAAHENTEVKTPKSRKQAEDVSDKVSVRTMKRFPLVKSLVIEILAYLCHESYSTQEAMRELHGLELILSNCVIDEDNSYIKEHSVLCLRFVLQNNRQNQEFVASLEAKQVVNADALSEAGYEVSIKDGKVKVRNSDSP